MNTVGVETTNHCNLKCITCPTHERMKRRRGYMSEDVYKEVLRQLDCGSTKGNPLSVGLSNWGEPLLHPSIIDYINMASTRSFRTSLVTNGTLLNRDLSKRLMDSGLDELTFSIDGVGKAYEDIRGIPYNNIKNKIDEFLSIKETVGWKGSVRIRTVVCESNSSAFKEIYDEWKGHGIEFSIQREVLWKDAERNDPCEFIKSTIVVLWNGDIVPCCVDYDGELNLGNVMTDNLFQVWDGKMEALRLNHIRGNYPSLCRKCTEWSGNTGDEYVGFRFKGRVRTEW